MEAFIRDSNVQPICNLSSLILFNEFIAGLHDLNDSLDDGGKRRLRAKIFQFQKNLRAAQVLQAKLIFDRQHSAFYALLPCSLSNHERRLVALMAMGYNQAYTAEILKSTVNTINVAYYRIRQKFNLSTTNELKTYAKSLFNQIQSLSAQTKAETHSNGSTNGWPKCEGSDNGGNTTKCR